MDDILGGNRIYKLNELIDNNTYLELEKYNLVTPIENAINSETSMIHIDPADASYILNNRKVAAYFYGVVNNIESININKILNSGTYGIIYIKASFNFSFTDAEKCINYVNKELNGNINFIYGTDITRPTNDYEILVVVTE